MANKMNPETIAMLQKLAAQDYNYREIAGFLDKINSNQGIEVDAFDQDQGRIVRVNLTAEEGWEFIKLWVENSDHNHNFSLSRRGSRHAQIEALLSDIRAKLSLRDQAASASSSLRQKARQAPPQTSSPLSDSYQKAHAAWAAQLDSLQKRLYDPLYLVYYNSPLLAHIKNDSLRRQAAYALAGDPTLAAEFNGISAGVTTNNSIKQTMRIHYLLSRAVPQLTSLTQEIYSDQFQKEAAITLSRAKEEIVNRYPGKVSGSIDYKLLNKDLDEQATLTSSSITLTSFEDNLTHLSVIPTAHQQEIVDHIRKIIVTAADGPQLSGQTIIEYLSKQKVLDQGTINSLLQAYPGLYDDIELLEIKARSEIIKASVTDRKRNRELYTQGLAEALGLSTSTFWLREQDLNNVTDHLLEEYGIKISSNKTGISLLEDKLVGLRQALDKHTSSELIDLVKYNELLDVTDKVTQFSRYQHARSGNPLFVMQDGLSKLNYNLKIIREPYDIASRKYWSAVEKIDDVIHYPFHKTTDWWYRLVDGEVKFFGRDLTGISITRKDGSKFRIPLLDLPGFTATHVLLLQKNVAVKTFAWSYKLAKKGGLYTAIFRPISNYSFVFAQVDGWREANFHFARHSIANFTNWASMKIWQKSWTEVATAGKAATWEFTLRVGNKLTKGAFGKAVNWVGTKVGAFAASLGLDLGTGGLTAALTVAMLAWEGLKLVVGFFRGLITNANGIRDKFLNWLPIIAGFFTVTLPGFLLAIPGFLSSALVGLLGLLGGALTSLGLLFSQAFLWAGAIIVGFILMFNIIKITTKIDPGLGLFTAVVCEENPSASKDPIASCASCLVQYLNKCYGPVVDKHNVLQGIGCLIASSIKPEVAELIQLSAQQNDWLQCVGFARAAALCGGKDLPSGYNACDYIGKSFSGLRYSSGGGGAVPGSICMLQGKNGCTSGDPGHIFVVLDDTKGAVLGVADANNALSCGHSGCVTDKTQIPRSSIAGCYNP